MARVQRAKVPGSAMQWRRTAPPNAGFVTVTGQWHIVSLRDGRLLRNISGTLDFAPPHTTGSGVRWNWVEDQHGWFYIENPAAPAANRRLKLAAGGLFSMVSNANSGDDIKWRFIVPYEPVEIATCFNGRLAS